MLQSNDWSFMPDTSYQNDERITGYLNNTLVWGEEPLTTSSALKTSSILAYPNPSNGNGTSLKVGLAGAGSDPDSKITVKIYTLSGRLIWSRTVPARVFGSSGGHVLYWNERDLTGARLANGLYFAEASVKSRGQTSSVITKVLILR
jgi:hypothetical protein